MSSPSFDLVDVVQTLRRRSRFLIVVTIIAALLGAASYTLGKKQYKAKASFLMANPVYSDRNNLFQDRQIQFVDYFAGDNDVDRMVTLAESDTVKYLLAERLNLAAIYKFDMSKPKDAEKLKNTIKDNYTVDRTEYNNLDISYVDNDPVLAAAVVNEAVNIMEEIFRDYYISQRMEIIKAFSLKIQDIDSQVNYLTDSLAVLRDKYKIYDLMNPARQSMSSGNLNRNNVSGFGLAMELVQNFESIKDRLVTDRSEYISLMNQYQTTINANNISLLHTLNKARVPAKPKPPGLILTTIGAAMFGFFFCTVYLLIITYYRRLISVER